MKLSFANFYTVNGVRLLQGSQKKRADTSSPETEQEERELITAKQTQCDFNNVVLYCDLNGGKLSCLCRL